MKNLLFLQQIFEEPHEKSHKKSLSLKRHLLLHLHNQALSGMLPYDKFNQCTLHHTP